MGNLGRGDAAARFETPSHQDAKATGKNTEVAEAQRCTEVFGGLKDLVRKKRIGASVLREWDGGGLAMVAEAFGDGEILLQEGTEKFAAPSKALSN